VSNPLNIPSPDQINRTIRMRHTDGRSPYMVRYPWAGWGHPTYAHRSLLCGDGEPAISTEPSPSRLDRSMDVLTFNDVEACVIEVGFPVRRPLKKWNKHGCSWSHKWWHDIMDEGYTYYDETHAGPRLEGSDAREDPPCPLPMSSTSNWPIILDVAGYTVGRPNPTPPPSTLPIPKRKMFIFRNIRLVTPIEDGGVEPESTWSDVQGAWQYDSVNSYRYNYRRKCTRILVWNGITEKEDQTGFVSFADGVTPWDATAPDYIGRRQANVGAAEYEPESPGDMRYRPWGFTDQPIPDWTRRHKGGEDTLRFESYHFSPHDDGPPGVTIGGDGDVTDYEDLDTLSATRIYEGYKYASMPWARDLSWLGVRGGCNLHGVQFSIVIEAEFWEYIVYKLIPGDGHTIIDPDTIEHDENGYPIPDTGEPYDTPFRKVVRSKVQEKGYMGAFGRMFIIY
jgi:hypothetical protein